MSRSIVARILLSKRHHQGNGLYAQRSAAFWRGFPKIDRDKPTRSIFESTEMQSLLYGSLFLNPAVCGLTFQATGNASAHITAIAQNAPDPNRP